MNGNGRNVIVVTVNYRLDIFGFLALNHEAAKGNFGLWDQKLALEWIHDNIAAFGGNTESVTIFGESAGGMCVSYQSVIPSNRGLFQRVISMSRVFDRSNLLTNKKIKEVAKDLANKTLCSLDDMFKFVDCLREMPFDDLLKITNFQGRNNQISFQAKFQPVVDGELYEVHPISRLGDSKSEEASFFKCLDFMTGLTSNEGSMLFMMVTPLVQYHYDLNITEGIPSSFVCEGMVSPYVELHFKGKPEIKQQLCDFYTVNTSADDQSLRATDFIGDISFAYSTMKMLEYHASLGGRSFQYVFSKLGDFHLMGPPPSWFKGCGHGEDLQHFFDFSSMIPPTTDGDLDGKEKEFSRQVIRYWTSFAKSG